VCGSVVFGWAVKELIDVYSMKVNNDQTTMWPLLTMDAECCLELAEKMKILHHEAVTDIEYVKKLYPLSVTMYNMGGLCLVSEPFFAFGLLLLRSICSHMVIQQLKAGDRAAYTIS